MGDHLACVVFDTFVSAPRPPTLSIYEEMFGISLVSTLNTWFQNYELGLRFVSTVRSYIFSCITINHWFITQNEYECHSFVSPPPNWVCTVIGTQRPPTIYPILHGRRIAPPHPEQANNPPPGLFRWQYLQCIIKKFGQADYKNLHNIHYMELPLRMEGDSDDEGTDDEFEWPSAVFDRGRYVQARIEHDEERQRFVADWTKGL